MSNLAAEKKEKKKKKEKKYSVGILCLLLHLPLL
jgi:hypothetical protein